MARFRTPQGEVVEAFAAMADLFRRRGWREIANEPGAFDESSSDDEPADEVVFDLP